MGFLRFILQLIDFLAWPVVALGYPLFASIQAIETGSKHYMRKLVTYWTIFSFISLFEHVFERIIECIHLWPYIKLITVCCLVIPQFDGACYFYQNLIHPCSLVKLNDVITQFCGYSYVYQRLLYLWSSSNLQTINDWFNKPMKDPSLKNEAFLAVAERYLDENGTDALEKLIANKTGSECVGPFWEDVKVMEHMVKHEAAEAIQDKNVKESLMQIEEKTIGMQVKDATPPADAKEIKLPETMMVQREWTCAICQVTTSSENNLKCHLRGRKHWEKREELKNFKKTVKTERNSKENSQVGDTEPHKKQKQVKNAAGAAAHNPKLWCHFCSVWCTCEIDMAAHLNGKKHLAKLQEMITSAGGT